MAMLRLDEWSGMSGIAIVILRWLAMTSSAFTAARACPILRKVGTYSQLESCWVDWPPGEMEKHMVVAREISLTQDTTAPILTVFVA